MTNSEERDRTIVQRFLTQSKGFYAIFIGVASLGPGGARAPPDFLQITITQTSRSAVYNTEKSNTEKNSVNKTFYKTFI